MKLAYVFADWKNPAIGSGAMSVHVQEVCAALQTRGIDVVLLAGLRGGASPLHPDMRVFELGSHRFVRGRLGEKASGMAAPVRHGDGRSAWSPVVLSRDVAQYVFRKGLDFYFYLNAQRIVAQEKPNVIYERYVKLSRLGVLLARRNRIPLVVEFNAPYALEARSLRTHNPMYMWLVSRTESVILRQAQKVIAVSPVVKGWLHDVYDVAEKKISLIPNGADETRFHPDVDGSDKRSQFGLDGSPVIGFLGSFQPWHDLRTLIDASETLVREGSDFTLMLAGDGPGLEAIQNRVAGSDLESRVRFVGRVAPSVVPEVISLMDVAVALQPRSSVEFHGSPIKIFEYMASGKAILASSNESLDSLVTSGEDAILVEPGDTAAVARALKSLLGDPEERRRLGSNARESFLRHYTWNRNVDTLLGLFDEIGGEVDSSTTG